MKLSKRDGLFLGALLVIWVSVSIFIWRFTGDSQLEPARANAQETLDQALEQAKDQNKVVLVHLSGAG